MKLGQWIPGVGERLWRRSMVGFDPSARPQGRIASLTDAREMIEQFGGNTEGPPRQIGAQAHRGILHGVAISPSARQQDWQNGALLYKERLNERSMVELWIAPQGRFWHCRNSGPHHALGSQTPAKLFALSAEFMGLTWARDHTSSPGL